MISDDNIIRSVLNGNKNDFAEIVDRYKKYVFSISLGIVKNHHEAENVAQEVFIQIYRSLHSYEFKGFKTWIGRIATNKAIDYRRKNSMELSSNVIYMDDLSTLNLEQEDTLHNDFVKNEDKKRLLSICNELPDIYGMIIKKYYLQSKSYSEIALEEGISIKTVESRLYRGKKILRDKWKEEI